MTLQHRKTGLFVEVEHYGDILEENDIYTHDKPSATQFQDKKEAIALAKRLGLRQQDFQINLNKKEQHEI